MALGCCAWLGGRLRLVVVLVVLGALSLVLVSRAEAYVYWVNQATGSIGRANLDGTGVNQNFITGIPSAEGVAVPFGRYDANRDLVPTDPHIYWTKSYGIGRANLDGSDVRMDFIRGLSQDPMEVAVYNTRFDVCDLCQPDYPEYLVWTEAPYLGTTSVRTLIGSALLPGSGCPYEVGNPTPCVVRERWIDTLSTDAYAIAVGATGSKDGQDDSGQVYWSALTGQSIGRANLPNLREGQPPPSFTESFIRTATNYTLSRGVAVRQDGFCSTCGQIYWVNRSVFDFGGLIGRANLDGTGVMPDFINFLTGYSADSPEGVAVDPARYDSSGGLITTGAHIYFTMPNSNRIGRANLDGTGLNLGFITGAAEPWGVAVDAGGSTGTSLLTCQPVDAWEWDCTATVTTHAGMAPRGKLTFAATVGTLSPSSCTLPASSSPVAVPGTSGSCQFRYSLPSTANGLYTFTAAYSGDALNAASSTSIQFGIERQLLSTATQSATSWQEGQRRAHAASTNLPIGTTFAFTLKHPARVWFLFTYRTVGRLVGGKCVPQSNANRNRTRCLRTVRAAFSRQAPAGRTRLHFEGHINRKRKLPPGLYRLIIIATANHHWSKPAILRFAILPTKRHTTPASHKTPAFTG